MKITAQKKIVNYLARIANEYPELALSIVIDNCENITVQQIGKLNSLAGHGQFLNYHINKRIKENKNET